MRKFLKAVALLMAVLTVGATAIMPVQAVAAITYVRSLGYWKTHNIYATHPALQESWPIMEDTPLCGMTYYEIVNTSPKGCAWIILAQQWIVVLLNAFNGCELPPDVYQALWEADDLLYGCSIPDEDREAAIGMAELFAAYNEGLLGVPAYPD